MGIFLSTRLDRIPTLTGVLAFSLLHHPLSFAQTAQQLMNNACVNETHQQASGSLWESTSERHTGGHVYISREIETVDGDVQQLLTVDGHTPTGADKSKNDKVLQGLLKSAHDRDTMHATNVSEHKDTATLMQTLPRMFLLEDRGETNGVETISFKPNPVFQPQSYEQRAIHGMSGTFYIQKNEMRLTAIDASVLEPVQFGYGLFGTLAKGGTFNVRRVEVAHGIWKTQSSKINLSGRVALVKNMTRQQEEVKSNWHPLPAGTTVLQALAMLGLHS